MAMYLVGAGTGLCLGVLIGVLVTLWVTAVRSHQDDTVTMSQGRRYDLTRNDAGHG